AGRPAVSGVLGLGRSVPSRIVVARGWPLDQVTDLRGDGPGGVVTARQRGRHGLADARGEVVELPALLLAQRVTGGAPLPQLPGGGGVVLGRSPVTLALCLGEGLVQARDMPFGLAELLLRRPQSLVCTELLGEPRALLLEECLAAGQRGDVGRGLVTAGLRWQLVPLPLDL